SAVGLGSDRALFERWWPADLHVIGKDITRFHTVIWPAMLMSAGIATPRHVFAHGFMTLNGQRMSKTLGTILDPVEAASRFGVDPLRLYLVKEVSFGGDGDFSWERYDERYNVDLANNLGNLVSRVTSMAHRYRQGRLSPADAGTDQLARLTEQATTDYQRAMDSYALHEGAAAVYRLIDATNEFIAATAPWALAKDPAAADRLSAVLFDAAEAIRIAAVLLTPIMPASAVEILRRVGAGSAELKLERAGRWRREGDRVLLQEGPLCPRNEQTTLSDNITSPAAATKPTAAASPIPSQADSTPASDHGLSPQASSPQTPPSDNRISIDDFMKVELRVAKVLAAERVPKSKKL